MLDVEILETGLEDVVALNEVDCFFEDKEDVIFLVEEDFCVGFVEVVTKAGVAVIALQT